MTDLRSRLHDVVDVPDGAPAHLTGHTVARGATAIDDVLVGALTARVRRRRAVRAGTTGALTTLTAAAVVMGGAALADGIGTRGGTPAASDPTVAVQVLELTLDCGDRVSLDDIQAVDGGLAMSVLELATARYPAGRPVDVTVRIENLGDPAGDDRTYAWDAQQVVRLAAVQDGTVVATAALPIGSGSYAPGTRFTTGATVELTPCAPEADLPAGDYQLVASAVLANADGSELIALAQGPVEFTLDPPPTPADQAVAEDAVQALLAGSFTQSAGEHEVGACGTTLWAPGYQGLTVQLTLPTTRFRPGELIEGDAVIAAPTGSAVLGTGPITAVHVVLARDGVVVGRGDYDPEHRDLMTFTAENPYHLPAYGNAIVCTTAGTGADPLGLPEGTYQAYGLYEVELEQVRWGGDEIEAHTDTVTVISDPVDVLVAMHADTD